MTDFDINSIVKLVFYISSFPFMCYIMCKLDPPENFHTINNLFLSNNYLSILFFSTSIVNQVFNYINLSQLGLSLVCIKYSLINIMFPMSLKQLDMIKRVMWLYTTPVMINQYCKTNNVNIWVDIKIHYYLLCLLITFTNYYENNVSGFFLALIPGLFFMTNLQKYVKLKHTTTFLQIWYMYTFIITFDYFKLFRFIDYQNLFLLMNVVGKGVWMLSISECMKDKLKTNDYETVQNLSQIIKNIDKEIQNFNNSYDSLDIYRDLKRNIISYLPENGNYNNDVHKNLLKAILPFNLDENFISRKKTYKKYDNLVILLTDIVGYSSIAKEHSNDAVFYLLNEMYLRFDKILKKFDSLQKIETIGDAYMVVGDLNNRYTVKNVAEQIIEIAHLFIRDIKNINTNHIVDKLEIRVGISVGPVIVGILGNKVPRMSVVGHAVNLAARLQSSTLPDHICISREVYDIIKDKQLHFKPNTADLKNIGETLNYTISVKPKLSVEDLLSDYN